MSLRASELLPGATLLISLKLGLALEVRVFGQGRADRVVPSKSRRASSSAWTKVLARLDRYENGFFYLQVVKPMTRQPLPYNGPAFEAVIHRSAIKRVEAINPHNNAAKIHPFEEGRHIPWNMTWLPWQTKQVVLT